MTTLTENPLYIDRFDEAEPLSATGLGQPLMGSHVAGNRKGRLLVRFSGAEVGGSIILQSTLFATSELQIIGKPPLRQILPIGR